MTENIYYPRMKKNIRSVIRLTLAALLWIGIAQARPVALVLDTDGDVTAHRDAGKNSVQPLDYLFDGADIDLAANTMLDVSVYASAQKQRFLGPARLRVSGGRITVLSGAAAKSTPIHASVQSVQAAALASADGTSKRLRIGGIVMRSGAIDSAQPGPLFPSSGNVASRTPTLAWTNPEGIAATIELKRTDGRAIGRWQTQSNHLQIPASAGLQWDDRVQWSVSLSNGDTLAGRFSVASQIIAESLAFLRPQPQAPIADWTEYWLLVDELNLEDEAKNAREHVRTLRRSRRSS